MNTSKDFEKKLTAEEAKRIRDLRRGVSASPLPVSKVRAMYPHISDSLVRIIINARSYGGKSLMKQRETAFKEKVIRRLKSFKNVWLTKVSQKSVHGTPDILASIGGLFVAIELKAREDSRRSALQKKNLRDITQAGGVAFVLYPENYTKNMEILKQISNDLKPKGIERFQL